MTDTTISNTDHATTDLDPRHALGRAMDAAVPLVQRAATADPDLPTPCDAYTLRDLTLHLIGVGRRIVAMGNGHPAASEPPSFEPADGDWVGAWQGVLDGAAATWPHLGPDAPIVVPWATLPASQAAGAYTSEVLVHTWDLARAVGADFAPDAALVDVAFEAMRRQVPDTDRRSMFAEAAKAMPPGFVWVDPFGEAVQADDDTSPIERLVAFTGRAPDWSPPAR